MPNGIIPIPAENASLLADALEIADEGARTDIELHAPCVRWMSRAHYDIGRTDPMWRAVTDRATRYLKERGLIEICDGNIVRILGTGA